MTETSYPARLGMPILTIDKIKNIIFEDIKRSVEKEILDEKQCFHVVGPAGVGKTQIAFQIAEELGDYFKETFHIKKINSPVLTRDDFLVPYPSAHDETFKMRYSDFIPTAEEKMGLFVIDECSRGDQQLQQMMWQIQNENQLHSYKFPKGWFVITIDNPDDDNYQINNMEDAAGLRRCLHLYTKVSPKAFIDYALKSNFHPHVISYIENYNDKLYDFDNQKQGKIYANPATWEKVSNHLYKYNDDLQENIGIIEVLCGGLLNIYSAKHFCDYLKNLGGVVIKPEQIFYEYLKDKDHLTFSESRGYIKSIVEKKQNNKLYEILNSFIEYLCDSKPEPIASGVKNTLSFLMDMPMDIAAGFVTHLGKLQMGSSEHLYLMSLMVAMNNESEDFKENFFNKLLNLGG